MIHVVVTVESPVPAPREHELETDAAVAVRIDVGLVGEVVAVQGCLVILGVVVQTVEPESTLGKDFLSDLAKSGPIRLWWVRLVGVSGGVGQTRRVSSKHTEPSRESLDDLWGVRKRLQKVVAGIMSVRCLLFAARASGSKQVMESKS